MIWAADLLQRKVFSSCARFTGRRRCWGALVLVAASLVAVSTSAQALELEAGTLNSIAGDDVSKNTRINFAPLVDGENTVSVAWTGSPKVRFNLAELAPDGSASVFFVSPTATANPQVWTGDLDTAKTYSLFVWVVTGEVDYVATLNEPSDPDPDPDNGGDLLTTFSGTLDSSQATAPRWVPLELAPLAQGNRRVTISWTNSDSADVRFRVINRTSGVRSPVVQGSNPGIWTGSLDLNDDVFIGLWSNSGVTNYTATVEATDTTIPLTIDSQPADVIVTEGDDATFSVATSDGSIATYQWFADGSAIADATSSTLTLTSVSLAQDGVEYSVTVTDGNSSLDSSPATLTVETRVTGPVTVATIASGALDSTKDTAPRWVRLDFEPLIQGDHTIRVSWDNSESSDIRFRVNASSGTFFSDIVHGSNPGIWTGSLNADESYYLALWSTNGLADYSATIEATVPLAIDSDPVSLMLTEGANAVFFASASGSGTLTYQWLADGAPIAGATQDSLTVYNTTTADSGTQYSVQVSDGTNTVTSSAATLTVNSPISLGLFSDEADEGAWFLEGPAPTLDYMADATTDAWGQELLRVGDVLLVGGDFDGIRQDRELDVSYQPYLAALDAVTGQPVTFNVPSEIDSVVRALALSPDGQQVYVGGDFGFVALNAVTGDLEFSVDVAGGSSAFTGGQDATDGGVPANGRVFDIAVSHSHLYIGGDFARINGMFRGNIAKLTLRGELDNTFLANITLGFSTGRTAPVQAIALSPSADTVYVGGTFGKVRRIGATTFDVYPSSGGAKVSIAALDATTGTAYDYRYAVGLGPDEGKALKPQDIAVTDNGIVIVAWGGPNFLSFHYATGDTAPNQPLKSYTANGDVQALQIVGDHVFVGHHGEFFRQGTTVIPEGADATTPFKLHSFRIDGPTSPWVEAFPPEQAFRIRGSFGVWGIAASEDSVWIAGDITRAGTNGRAVDGLVRFPALP